MSKKAGSDTSKVGRSAESGRFMGVRIADPVVKPTTVTVHKIRDAVRKVTSNPAKASGPKK